MRHFLILLRHEIRMLLISPGAYIAAFLFLLVMGFVFQDLLTNFARQARETPPAADFFQLFWLPVFFMVPLLTMRSLAEERRSGTLETLMTTPVTAAEVVLSKFVAAYLYYFALWLITASFHGVLYYFAGEARLLDPGPLVGGYLFVGLSGLLFIAAGIFASAVSRSQLVAGIFSFALVFAIIIGGRYAADLAQVQEGTATWLKQAVEHVQVFQHVEDFASGVLDSRPLALYLTGSFLFLVLSVAAIEARSGKN
jgi:ABC-2 type transport system permease protein